MTFEELARSLSACETVDKSIFQRRARVLQALWRVEKGYECGEHHHKGVTRPLGSRLQMQWAEDKLANFMNDNVRAIVKAEVLDPVRSAEKLFGKPRIFNDLLSSQPLCFNLFAELRANLPSASRLVSKLTQGRFREVKQIEFEYSPARSDPRYSGDRSAFDVFLECSTKSGKRGFIGIEVKYHENLLGAAAKHRYLYDDIAKRMGCFDFDSKGLLRCSPLQQIWRDHLLAGAVRETDGYDDALFVIIYPKANEHCCAAIKGYTALLTNTDSFAPWYLEDVVEFLTNDSNEWAAQIFDRYCDFGKIERAMAAAT